MFLFAHTGITAGMIKLSDLAFPFQPENEAANGFRGTVSRVVNRLRNRDHIDYRIVFVGSMLPDIIDKPLAFLVNNTEIFNGRGFSHTMAATLLLLIAGAVFRRAWLFLLTLGMVFHLVLDLIWDLPETLFWPLLGWFPPEDTEGWFSAMWDRLFSRPEVYIPELIGLAFLIWLVFRVVRGSGIIRFINNGMIR